MNLLPDLNFQMRLVRWSKYLSAAILLIASLVLLGWWFDIDVLKKPLSDLVTMNPLTAVLFILASLSFLFLTSDGRIMAIVRDITERKKAEEKLKKSNERFEMIAATTHDAIWEWNLITNEIWGNEMHQRIYGLSTNDSVPTEEMWKQHIHPDERDATLANLNKALRSNKNVWIAEYRFQTSGGYRNIYDRSYIVRDDAGNPVRIMGSMMDITERKKAEVEIKKHNERFEMIASTTHDAIWEWNLETNELWANERHQQLYGLTVSDPVPLIDEWKERIHPDDLEKTVKGQDMALASEKNAWISEYRFKTETGEYKDIYDRTYIVRNVAGKAIRLMGSMMDITERKKTENELRRSEAQYRSLIEQASDAIMITDLNGNFIDVNSSLCEMFGYDKQELMQSNVRSLIDSQNLKERPMRFDELEKGKHVFSHRRMLHKNGSIIEVEANVKMIPDGRVLAIARDITERIKAENAIRTSEETRRLIMNSALDAIITMNKEGLVTGWNPEAEKIFGWKADEIIGKTLKDTIIPHKYREQHKKGLDHYMKSDKGTALNRLIEITALDRSGKEFPIELSIVPIRQGTNEFFCGFLRDITERKMAEDKIRKEKELSDCIINSLPGVFYLYDETGSFLRWNKNFEVISGYSSSEMSQRHPLDFFDSDEKELLKEKIRHVFEKGMAEVEAHFFTKSKERIPYYFNGWRIIFEGKPCLIGVGIDISDRKQAEEKLKQSYEDIRRLASHLEQIREEERIHIAREIHDELGQQLTVLKMDISWLNKKLDKKDLQLQKKVTELLDVVDNTVKTVRRISTELRPSILDDLGLLAALEWQCHEFEKRSGIKTSFLSNTEQLKLSSEIATGLFRVFQESVTNVARHADATKMNVTLNSNHGNLLLIIKDNGKGFLTAGIENKKTLGILGMRERVLLMGGEFKIISVPGNGTEIQVWVPGSIAP